jgi:hypothetical protein
MATGTALMRLGNHIFAGACSPCIKTVESTGATILIRSSTDRNFRTGTNQTTHRKVPSQSPWETSLISPDVGYRHMDHIEIGGVKRFAHCKFQRGYAQALLLPVKHYGASARDAHPKIEYFSAINWRYYGREFGRLDPSELGAQETLLDETTHYKGLEERLNLTVGNADALPSKETRIN